MEAIEIKNLIFTYPKQTKPALNNINISIEHGEFVTICGKSGCGKSTLLKHLRSVLTPYGSRSGSICYNNKPIASMNQREQTISIGYVQQSPDNQIVTDKVWHELAFGLESLGYKTTEIRSRVSEMASFFGIQTWFHKKVTELSGGQKQLLNLASIMVMQPSVLVLDEPTSQLDPIAATDFLETIKKINRELGTTIILTEHRLEDALPMSDRVIVMDEGSIIVDDTPINVGQKLKKLKHDMFLAMPTPMRVYAGVDNDLSCPITVRDGRNWLEKINEVRCLPYEIDIDSRNNVSNDKPVIELDEVWFRYEKNLSDVVKGLTLSINKGEIFSIVGGNGTGKTTSLSIIGGIFRPYRGSVKICGVNLNKFSGENKISESIGILPQNPQTIFVKKTVELDLYEMLADRKISKEEKILRINEVISLCELQDLINMHPYDLSGGEQQRAALAKVLLLKPKILLLDEPTKGLDGHFKIKLAGILNQLKAEGITIVMVSHDIEFCAAYADKCAMFFDGSITSIDAPREFFSGKNFYTTAANRMSRTIIKNAVLAEDIIKLCNKDNENNEDNKNSMTYQGSADKELRINRNNNINNISNFKSSNNNNNNNNYKINENINRNNTRDNKTSNNRNNVAENNKINNNRNNNTNNKNSKNSNNNISYINETINIENKSKINSTKNDSIFKLTPARIITSCIFTLAFLLTIIFLWNKCTGWQKYVVQFSLIVEAAVAISSIMPGKDIVDDSYQIQVSKEKRKLSKRTLISVLIILFIIPFTIYFGVFFLGDRKYYFISLLIIIETIIPFAFVFESRKPQAREIAIISVLCAIAVAGRAAFFMLPQFKPLVAIVVISGVCFGGETGFLVGAVSAFVSNMFFGQGPITPWQMFAFGIVGLLAGVCFRKGLLRKKKSSLCIFGALATMIACGIILDIGSALTWQPNPTFPIIVTYCLRGIPFNIIHAAATSFFLWFISEPMIEKLDRIKTKYGIIDK